MVANVVPDLGDVIVRWLAVLGAAALGAFLAGLVLKVLVRFVTSRPVPALPRNVVRLLGGVALGWAVYILVFGPGGHGFGLGSGGGWDFFGKGEGPGGGPTTPQATARERPETAPAGPPVEPARVLRVEMLGGDRYKGETRDVMDRDKDPYYLVDDRPEPQTWVQVRDRIQQRNEELKGAGKGGLKELEIVIRKQGSVGEAHQAVKALKDLADTYSLTVKVVKPAGS